MGGSLDTGPFLDPQYSTALLKQDITSDRDLNLENLATQIRRAQKLV